jgi:hypothetical protein
VSERPPEALLWDFLRGATMTKALAAVVDAGVPEALAGGPRTVEELAGESGAHPQTLHRLLRALASDGVFREERPGRFAHTDESRLLLAPSWHAFAHLFGGVFYDAVTDLRADTAAATFPQRFGREFWPWLAEHPDERSLFDTAMAGGKARAAERIASLEWPEGETLVDVGGGNGALLLEILARVPGVRGIVFDLPETVRDEATFGDRCKFVAGNFFDSVPAADAYVLSGILHDWDDGDATTILRTIRGAARPHARLLIAESVIPPDNAADGAKWLDLLMLVLAGGRERTEPDWRSLLAAGGFRPESIESGLIQASVSDDGDAAAER